MMSFATGPTDSRDENYPSPIPIGGPPLGGPTLGGDVRDGRGRFNAGESFGDFTLERLLGEGGAGQVWLASNTFTGRRVAVKMCTDPGLRKTLANEAMNLGTLMTAARRGDFPETIVQLYETHLTFDPAFLVMEFVEGGDVRNLLRREGTHGVDSSSAASTSASKTGGGLSERRTLQILLDVIEALAYAHDLGIAHRDIKPENILIDGDGRARVSDFGLGQVAAENLLSVSRSLATQDLSGREISGTFDYMSPEQLAGATEIGAATDMYALGVVIYELLTGERPRGLTMPTRRRPDVHQGWDRIFEHCYAHEPSDRFTSMQDLRATLREEFATLYPDLFAGVAQDAVARKYYGEIADRSSTLRGGSPVERKIEAATQLMEDELRDKRPGFLKRRRLRRRRTADLLNVERESELYSRDEKLRRFQGYGLFGWFLPGVLWVYLSLLAISMSREVPTFFSLCMGAFFVFVACYLIYGAAAGWKRSALQNPIVIFGSALPIAYGALLFIFILQSVGAISTFMVLALHWAFLRDVQSKLRRRRAAAQT